VEVFAAIEPGQLDEKFGDPAETSLTGPTSIQAVRASAWSGSSWEAIAGVSSYRPSTATLRLGRIPTQPATMARAWCASRRGQSRPPADRLPRRVLDAHLGPDHACPPAASTRNQAAPIISRERAPNRCWSRSPV